MTEQDRNLPKLDRYEILESLGEGGAAEVYRARDRELGREVAVKFLRESISSNPVARERFLREARVCAGLAHPNIITVHDVGEAERRPYMVMEFVLGRPLKSLLDESVDPIGATRILEKAARGAGEAHAHGVIHRDLKPANIFIPDDGEPKVGDFGLAHVTGSETGLTRTGTTLGTPLYMAPEQAEGRTHDISARTDVYALGAVLYEGLTGRPPHEGESSMEIFGKITREDPVPPRKENPDVPAELEAICLKALDKEPGRRYADGNDFADDLERFLAGDPVEARPASAAYRAWRRIRRNPLAALLGLAAVLAVAVGAFVAVSLVRSGSREAEAADLVVRAERMYEAGKYEETERLARRALGIIPDHELGRYWLTRLNIRRYQTMRGVPPSRVVRGVVEILPPRPESPEEQELRLSIEADFAGVKDRPLGRGISALWAGDYAEAVNAFARVPPDSPGGWEGGFFAGVALYLTGDFQRAQDELARHRIRDPGLTLPVWIRTLTALGQRLERRGRDSEPLYVRARAACLELGAGPADLLEAQVLLAWARMELSRGRDPSARIDKAVELVRNSGTVEGMVLFGDALLARAEHLARFGKLDADDPSELKQAIEILGRAIERDERYVPAWLRRGDAHFQRWEYLSLLSNGRIDDLEAAIRDYTRAVEINPQMVDAAIRICDARFQIAEDAFQDPEEILAACETNVAAMREICARHPNSALAARALGGALQDRAYYLGEYGRDPKEDFVAALEILDRAVEMNPTDVMAYQERARARQNYASALHRRGEDSEKEFELAIRDLQRACELNPLDTSSLQGLGLAWQNFAASRETRGEEIAGHFREALESFGKAIEIDPGHPISFRLRGMAYKNRASWKENRGEDPIPDYEAAIRDFETSLKLSDLSGWTVHLRGIARQDLANYRSKIGEDPIPDFRLAAEDMRAAIGSRRGNPNYHRILGQILLTHANHLGTRGLDPLTHYREALEALDVSLALDPLNVDARISRATARMNRGRHVFSRGGDPLDDYRAAKEDLDEAVRLNPKDHGALRHRATLHQNQASFLESRGRDSAGEHDAAEADLTKAIQINPNASSVWRWRGLARQNRAGHLASLRKNAVRWFELAIEDFTRAIELNPKSFLGYQERGLALQNFGAHLSVLRRDPLPHYEKAIRDLGRAAELNPKSPTAYRNLGLAWLNIGTHRLRTSGSPVEDFSRAVEELNRSLRLNATDGSTYRFRALARINLCTHWLRTGKDARPDLTKGVEDLGLALRHNPRDTEALLFRGYALMMLGRKEEGRADLDRAVELNPALKPRADALRKSGEKQP